MPALLRGVHFHLLVEDTQEVGELDPCCFRDHVGTAELDSIERICVYERADRACEPQPLRCKNAIYALTISRSGQLKTSPELCIS